MKESANNILFVLLNFYFMDYFIGALKIIKFWVIKTTQLF